MRRQSGSPKPSNEQLARDIRGELRGILRGMEELNRPIQTFCRVSGRPEGHPSFFVAFNNEHPRDASSGLRQAKKLTLPDERITDTAYDLAGMVWHLKDRLKQWARATTADADVVEAHAQRSPDLVLCADLINWKKHGRSENLSGSAPQMEVVEFDTSHSGVFEFFYSGATKDKILYVSETHPIHFAIPIMKAGSQEVLGDAASIISRAFEHWKPLIERLGVLHDDNRESVVLRVKLYGSTERSDDSSSNRKNE